MNLHCYRFSINIKFPLKMTANLLKRPIKIKRFLCVFTHHLGTRSIATRQKNPPQCQCSFATTQKTFISSFLALASASLSMRKKGRPRRRHYANAVNLDGEQRINQKKYCPTCMKKWYLVHKVIGNFFWKRLQIVL